MLGTQVNAFYTGNGGTAITANVTNIDFTTQVRDSNSAWSGTTFTTPPASPGTYTFTGMVFTTAGVTATLSFYVNGTIKQALGGGTSARVFPFSFSYFLNAGDTLTIRSDTGCTLSNSATLHWISITG